MATLSVDILHSARCPVPFRARSTFLRHFTSSPLKVSFNRLSSVKALQNGVGRVVAQHSTRNEEREEMLWQRQQQLWDREMQRWDAERDAWSQREAFLLQQIADLQSRLLEYASIRPASSASSIASPLPGLAVERSVEQSSPPTQRTSEPSPSASPATPESAGLDLAERLAVSLAESLTVPKQPESSSTGPFTVSDLQAMYQSKASEIQEGAWAADFARAMAAVDETDVLAQEAPFTAVKPQRQHEEAVAAEQVPQAFIVETDTGASTGGSEEVGKSAGSPPVLTTGADDIFWVNQLHRALDSKGFSPGEEEGDFWYFGEQTLSALLTFQASVGLPETGVCDEDTWNLLLGAETVRMRLIEASALELLDSGDTRVTGSSNGQQMSSNGTPPSPSSSAQTKQQSSAPAENGSSGAKGQAGRLKTWPILREGEGGAEVHGLQVALNNKGYYCGEDDSAWWQFGMDTYSSLITFQACNNLAETGIADEATWKALLGSDASPSDILALKSGDNTDDDLQEGGDMVWLLGEQRWEVRR
ncbi:probable protein disulfide isomerase pTAC5, chloroplastic at N-terminal half [Coccomyxa sp. Obi]|nr:probable protein disulfide isomerase pTAC5, chloroplastic at N-terminal half [Coccomyxa sp. Obi]